MIYAGSETRVVVETQSRLQVTARSFGSAELVPGQPISISWMTDKGVLLP
ncbi:TOBE domain-containing protein [Pseudomonas sp. CFBP 13711]|nr:TOBE domain-containing protein [Pseudomonas sp. CFBP 13711]MBD8715606.1 TOBE domain-containing protein [Pseudomonas sp. CFBP 13715]